MVFDEFGLEINRKHFLYNTKEKFFYLPNEDVKINISAEEALIIIGASVRFLWDSKKISQRILWEHEITEEMISKFLKEYSEGHFEKVIAWICDNDIECHDKDKFDYLARYNFK